MFNIQIKGLDKVYQKIGQENTDRVIQLRLKKGIIIVGNEVSKEAPVGNGLLRNISKSYIQTVGKYEAKLQTKQPYALAVHNGTRPHMPPVGDRSDQFSLAFRASRKGINPRAVAMSIKKKGTKANPYIKRAMSNAEDPVRNLFIRELSKAL